MTLRRLKQAVPGRFRHLLASVLVGCASSARSSWRDNRLVSGPRFRTVLACAALAAAAGYGVSPAVLSATPAVRVAMLNLTNSDRYDSIAVVGSRIVLYGPAGPSAEYPSTSSTCSSAVVSPSTLALSDLRSGSCADPEVSQRSVIPAISVDKDLLSSSGGPSAVVRIARVTSVPPGYSLGPVVMTFPALAWGQTEPSWTYGGGDLWLYDWVDHFDLLRISATTGAVLQRLVVPRIQSPLLAFNEDGLWVAPTGESSGALYRLAPDAAQMSPVFNLGPGGFAWWLVASGDSVWVEDQPRPVSKPATIFELRGPGAAPVWHGTPSPALKAVVEQVPFASPSIVVGNGSDGLWTVVVSASRRNQQVVRVAPGTGRLTVVATLSPGYPPEPVNGPVSMLASWQATTFDGSLFLLDPPAELPGTEGQVGGFSALYRVSPGGA